MVLVDTSVWIDHLNRCDAQLSTLLFAGKVLSHPFVVGEIALGNLKNRNLVLDSFLGLPRAVVANEDEVLTFIDAFQLFGKGIGYVDAHLLASARLTGTVVWTRDKRFATVAKTIGLNFAPSR